MRTNNTNRALEAERELEAVKVKQLELEQEVNFHQLTASVPPKAGKININGNFTRHFYSVYRPILLTAYHSQANTAFLRAELFVNRNNGSGNWEATGCLMNAYDNAGNNKYVFNVMEYCRPYVGLGIIPVLSGIMNFQVWRDTARFKLVIWPVNYSNTAVGALVDAVEDATDSQTFVGVAATTNELEETGGDGGYVFLDRYVLGHNYPGGRTPMARALTNMPHNNILTSTYVWKDKSTSILGNAIDMSDIPNTAISYLNTAKKNTVVVLAKDGITGTPSMAQVSFQVTQSMLSVPTHPIKLAEFVDMHLGYAWNKIINANGDLIASEVEITVLEFGYTSGSNYWGYAGTNFNSLRYQLIKYTDKANKKGIVDCNTPKTRFHFLNHLGGYDFFNAYGTKEKSVSVKSTVYEKHNDFALRGLRGRQELWTKREDIVKVVTQPITKEMAVWLEELVVSPQVWIEEDVIGKSSSRGVWGLIPISIIPGSYSTYNTDDNIHYMEFKYTLSNARTQQRG